MLPVVLVVEPVVSPSVAPVVEPVVSPSVAPVVEPVAPSSVAPVVEPVAPSSLSSVISGLPEEPPLLHALIASANVKHIPILYILLALFLGVFLVWRMEFIVVFHLPDYDSKRVKANLQ